MNKGFIKLLTAAVLVTITGNLLSAQERTLGTWKAFMPYGNCFGVFNAGDRVYSASLKSMFSYDKATGAIQIYDKATGLSDIGMKTAGYDPATGVLAIAYQNSNIDLVFNGTDIYNIQDFRNAGSGTAIGINAFSFFNGNAYISSDAGISVLNLNRKEISNTYTIGSTGGQVKVYATTLDAGNIYAATAEGVKHASLSSPNLQNFNNWSLYDSTSGLPKKKATFITAYNNKVYAVIAGAGCDTLFALDGGTWSRLYYETASVFTSLKADNNTLYFTTNSTNSSTGKNGKIDATGQLTVVAAQHPRPLGWFESGNVTWEADEWLGLCKNINGNIERIIPDGPPSAAVFDLSAAEGTLYLAPGGVDDSWLHVFNSDGVGMYTDDKWTVINQFNNPVFQNLFDVLCVEPVPAKGKAYFGSFYSGLIECNLADKSVTLYDKNNSPLEGAVGAEERTRVSALATDRYGNVWISNAGALKPIKVYTADNQWKSFSVPYFNILMKKLIIDQNDQLWAPLRSSSGGGMLVWSYNGTIDDPSDDVSRLLTTGSGSGALPSNVVNAVAEDKDGNIWVGTNEGIAVFYCGGSILTTNGCDADQIKVERDGYIGYLFGTETIRAIAIDAANRKWVGTTNGVWLVSADGKQELLKFTTDNSPLPDNQITDIAIDNATGEVFIGTLGGMVSYQGDALSSDCDGCDKALVYPNPVKPDYDGPIAIKGLTENAYVKITDISGTLVYQGRANGSQMIWDGKGYKGTRVKSGVYLVFSSTDLGKQRRVAKILLSN